MARSKKQPEVGFCFAVGTQKSNAPPKFFGGVIGSTAR
jgi:hypothetical protein